MQFEEVSFTFMHKVAHQQQNSLFMGSDFSYQVLYRVRAIVFELMLSEKAEDHQGHCYLDLLNLQFIDFQRGFHSLTRVRM